MIEVKGKIAFIGSGNMARAIIGGIVGTGFAPENILVVNPGNPASTGVVQKKYGAVPAGPEALGSADVIVIAVKPQTFPDAAAFYKPFVNPQALFISIMAGLPMAAVEKAFGAIRVVRVMPNIAMAVGCGAAGYAVGTRADETDAAVTESIFKASGLAVRVTEAQIDDVGALSGSGAAYVYYLLETMKEAAVEDGIDPGTAAALARQTLLGAAKQLETDGAPPEELRKRITSKKGTTEAAINKMTQLGFPAAVKAGYRANKARAQALSEELYRE